MAADRKSRKSARHPSSSTDHHHHQLGQRVGQRQQSAERTPPTTAAKCISFGKKAIAFLFSHVGLCALVVGYAIGGALIFQSIEAPHEDKHSTVIKVNVLRNQTLEDLWKITTTYNVFIKESWLSTTRQRVQSFQNELIKRIKEDGYDGSEDGSWTFSGAFLFSLTIITTIGYGNIAPATDEGKILTIVYAIFGIPLMLLYLTNIGGILAKSFRFVYGRFCTCKPAPSAQEKRAALLRSRSLRLKQQRRAQMASANAAAGGSGALPTPSHLGSSMPGLSMPGPSSSLPNTPNATLTRQTGSSATLPRFGGGGGGISGGLSGSAYADQQPSIAELGILRLGRSLTDPNFATNGSDSDEFDDILDKASKKVEVHVPISLSLFLLITYVTGGGMLFSIWESEWGLLEGSYFCFISLSTIGFGDLVPGSSVVSGDGGSQERMVICSLYLLAGLALIAMCFNLMQEEVIHKVRNAGKRIGIIKDPEDEEFDEDER